MTDEEKQELLNAIKAESQDVSELTEVDSLDNVKSLPAMRGDEVVSAPLSLLQKPATDAAAVAQAAAKTATDAAGTATAAAKTATDAAGTANAAAQAADTAGKTATTAAERAEAAADNYKDTAELARNGATARFSGMVEGLDSVENTGASVSGGEVLYSTAQKLFVYHVNGKYYNTWNADGATSEMYNDGVSSVRKDKLFLLKDELWVWSDADGDLAQASGSGGGNLINVTEDYPLGASGTYYTLSTAAAAVEEKRRAKGRCISYETAQGVWATKQFTGTSVSSWTEEAAWADFGGDGTVKSVTVNGVKQEPDSTGNVTINIKESEADATLDAESTNPVQNKVVTAKVSELEAGTLFGSEVTENDDNTVTVSLKSKSAEITNFTIPAGGGGSGESRSTTKIVLGASVSHGIQKLGSANTLTWNYDHQYASGDDKGTTTGAKASVEIQIKRGSTVLYDETTQDVSAGTYSLDITDYLLAGTTDIYVKATVTDPTTGKTQTKQAYTNVKTVTLTLQSSYNMAQGIVNGGYASGETVQIPFAVSGSGEKTVTLYVDGVQSQAKTVTRSGTTNDSFTIAIGSLDSGRHTVQLVAEMAASSELTLRSESIYMDLYRSGESAPLIGTKMTHSDGHILGASEHLTPRLSTGQYEKVSLDFAVYDPSTTPATMSVVRNGQTVQTVSVARQAQTWSNRFTSQGTQTMAFTCGTTEYPFTIEVGDSGIEVSEASYGLIAKLDAEGRSNSEAAAEREQWSSNGIGTTFEGMDWSSSGWTGESLKLTNGAKATIGYQPFATDVKSTGLTIELTMKVSQVQTPGAPVVSCVDGGKGFELTTEEARFTTGETVTYENEDGETVTRQVKLGTNYVEDKWMKVALVIHPQSEQKLMELYVDGNRTGADLYAASFSFQQDNAQALSITSEEADVEIKKVRLYNRALSDDEELENRMVDGEDTDEMMALYDANDILGEDDTVSMDKLLKQGKGVLRIVRQGKMDDIYATNNKSTDFLADVYFYSPFGAEYNFVLKNCYIRIQGTSSTKYPSKNIRIYFSKGQGTDGSAVTLWINGVENPLGKNRYRMRPGAMAMNLFTMKSDYSDSSMSLNTGGAKLFNDVMKELGLLTPPQEWQYEQGGEDLSAVTVRTAIDGFPIDMFVAETVDGESEYVGQYNFNNEKSKSGTLFGMEGVDGFEPTCPMTFETLNNGAKVCLFQSDSDEDLAANFDAGCEANYPEDTYWNPDASDTKQKAYSEEQKTAIKRLWGWIRDCKADAEATSGKTATADDLSTWVSTKFKTEVGDYFPVGHLCTYYLWTDYHLSVDQRVKNMMLRTWDGLKWYLTYYDGDTQLGKRNDCFLIYLYNTMRDTYDAEKGAYAFEGRESWLWNLVLANLQEELKEWAGKLRGVLTIDRELKMLNEEQAGNWCDRAYNKSGDLKYIKPATQEMYGKVWPFIYALQGKNAAHREYFVRKRFALLDAKYGVGDFTSDNIDMYLNRQASDTADTVKVTANDAYAFGYGTNNQPNLANTGLVAAGEEASFDITGAYTVNDPIRMYGASQMKALDMSGAADHLKNGLDLGRCKVLRELTLESTGTGSTAWWLVIGACKQLRVLNVRNQAQVKTSQSGSELDLSAQTKLTTLDARGTEVKSVTLANGAPVTSLKLPGTLTTLRLEYLPQLTQAGLTLEGWTNVKTLIFDSCPGLDWETLLTKATGCERLRVTGIDREDDGTWLKNMAQYKGVDASGNAVDGCALVGTVRLTKYMEAADYEALKAEFSGELNIVEPEYTMIEFDDTVADDANVSNLDNGTGYKSGTAYVASGHIVKILEQRHRVLAKVTKKATTRSVTIAGVETTMNNLDGEMTYYPLDDTDSNKYADGTAAKLDGSEGDWMMLEPFFWSKGINDYLNGKHYSCYSSNDAAHEPARPAATVVSLSEIKASQGGYLAGKKIMTGKETLQNSYTADSSYSVCKVTVEGYGKVRFPTVPGTNLVGSIFVDATGTVVSSVVVPTLSSKFEAGMYVIADVPTGAVALHFTVLNTAEFDEVVLSNSSRIEDMEPEWVANDAHLCGVVGSSVVGSKLRAAITGGSTTANMTWTDFHYYSAQRGMQQIDALMHSRIANLFYAKYGRRNAQEQCGAGSHTNTRTTGGTASRGMTDTIGYEEAKSVNSNVTNSLIDGLVHQYAWYRSEDDYGGAAVTQVNNICCLGYEDIYGHKWDMMDGVDVPNDSGNVGKWRIWMPDGTTRMVKGMTNSGWWITAVAHGKWMDVVPVGNVNGSSSTYYSDTYWYSSSTGRVVYRGYDCADASGGVSGANAVSDASYSYASVGSRLAFRGALVKAGSVATYKAISEVA